MNAEECYLLRKVRLYFSLGKDCLCFSCALDCLCFSNLHVQCIKVKQINFVLFWHLYFWFCTYLLTRSHTQPPTHPSIHPSIHPPTHPPLPADLIHGAYIVSVGVESIVIIIIVIIINCNWVVTRWQWLFYMYCTQNMKLVTTKFKWEGYMRSM